MKDLNIKENCNEIITEMLQHKVAIQLKRKIVINECLIFVLNLMKRNHVLNKCCHNIRFDLNTILFKDFKIKKKKDEQFYTIKSNNMCLSRNKTSHKKKLKQTER